MQFLHTQPMIYHSPVIRVKIENACDLQGLVKTPPQHALLQKQS